MSFRLHRLVWPYRPRAFSFSLMCCWFYCRMAHRRQSHRKRKEIEPGALSDGTVAGNRGRKRQTIFSSEQFEGIASALRRRVAAKELGGCMEALAPLFGVKLVSDNPAHSAVPSDKTSRKFQVSPMACSCTTSQLHYLTATLPQLHCLTPPMPDGLQLHTRNG